MVYHLWSRDHRPSFAAVAARAEDESIKRMQRIRSQNRVKAILGMGLDRQVQDASAASTAAVLSTDTSLDASVGANMPTDASIAAHDSVKMQSAAIEPLYGLGKVRSLQEFEKSIGVDFASRRVRDGAQDASGLMGSGLIDGSAGFVFADSVDSYSGFGGSTKASTSAISAFDVECGPCHREDTRVNRTTAMSVKSKGCVRETGSYTHAVNHNETEPKREGMQVQGPVLSASAMAALQLVKSFMDA